MLEETRYDGVYKINGNLATKNFSPGHSVYGEELVNIQDNEYRLWDPNRSKLASAIKRGIDFIPLHKGSTVLYLGAASGTTASYVSDIVKGEGKVFSLDIAPRVVKELIFCCRKRKNMFPLLKDANKPDSYQCLVPKVDFVYQDIASADQPDILIKNCKKFLKSKGYALFMVKASSIDSSVEPRVVFKRVRKKLRKHFRIEDEGRLEPYHKKHSFYLLRKIK